MKTILITGAAGFVGSHIVEHFLKNTNYNIVIFDKLNYASMGLDRIRDIECFDETRVKTFSVDLQEPVSEGIIKEVGNIKYILNLASESHVDRSITNPVDFTLNNIKLTLNILEYARLIKPEKFIQFSTDEVYGPAQEGVFYKEGDRLNPSNPYSASKAAQESIVRAYANTYKIPCLITNTMNVIGERQHPEKFVPLVINKVLKGEKVTIHSDSTRTKSGTRCWIHARNIGAALEFILEHTNETLSNIDASQGQFHIVGEERSNLEIAETIAKTLGKELDYEMTDFHSERPGHDLRYAMSGDKLKGLGFEYPLSLDDSLEKTIKWSLENNKWLKI